MPSNLIGTWSLQESENFDEYMKAVGKSNTKLFNLTSVKFINYALYSVHDCLKLVDPSVS